MALGIYITSNHIHSSIIHSFIQLIIILKQNMLEINRRHVQMECTQTQCIEINGKVELLVQESYLLHMSYSKESHYLLETKDNSLIHDLLYNIYSFYVSMPNSSLVF